MDPFFEVLKSITYTKKPWKKLSEKEQNSIQPYLLHRYISMNQSYIGLVNDIQKLNIQDPEKLYKIYINLLPKKQQFLRYIRSNAKKIDEKQLNYVSQYFECSLENAKDYLELLNEENLNQIIQQLGINETKIKKSKTKIKRNN